MNIRIFAAGLFVFLTSWFAFLAGWVVLSLAMSDRFLTDLPIRPFFSGFRWAEGGMLAFSGQVEFAGTAMGAMITFLLAGLAAGGILKVIQASDLPETGHAVIVEATPGHFGSTGRYD